MALSPSYTAGQGLRQGPRQGLDTWSSTYDAQPARPSYPSHELRPLAVSVRRASHTYTNITFNGSTAVPALKDFNMTVRHGNIYALLGSSGCGKTTILRALVGQHKLEAGSIRVFGKEPRAPGSGVPGPTIGYMPQELAVYDAFTIAETLRFFGWLAGMKTEDIDAETKALVKMLELPHKRRIVGTLSGGQQRRLSFAVALLNSPPLLVLDEPTVGVDPLLRQSIWEHLLNMAQVGQTTVIITTHYIEEARQATVVGLMRHGAMLVEDSPEVLLSQFSCATLEEVLLKLCLAQEGYQDQNDLRALSELQTKNRSRALDEPLVYKKIEERSTPSLQRVKALLWKNLLWMVRHYVFAPGLAAMAGIICLIYCLAIGRFPQDLPVGVVNLENNCSNYDPRLPLDCNAPTELGCLFVERMRHYTIKPVYYAEEEAAVRAVKAGRSWGVVNFAENFSSSLVARASYHGGPGDWAPNEIVEGSNINVALDMSLQSIAFMLLGYLYLVQEDVVKEFDSQCHLTPHMHVPIQFKEPVYGRHDMTFLEFSLPGVVLGAIFVLGLTTTMSSLLPEKTERVLERALVSGVTMTEVLVAQFVSQLFITVGMVVGSLAVSFGVFQSTLLGSMTLYAALCFCQGICGMWLGFFLAVLCDTTTAGSLVGTGCYFSFVFMSSMLWPMEGMHFLVRGLCWVLPMTTPTVALRYIALRAWDLSWTAVQLGFISSIAWSCIFLGLTLITIKIRF